MTMFKPKYDLDLKNIVVWELIVDEEHVIPSEAPFEIFLDYIPHWNNPSSVSIKYADTGSPLVEVVDEPTASGTFRVAYNDFSGRVIFHPADAGQSVLVSYEAIGSVLRAVDINELQDVVSIADTAIQGHLSDMDNPHNVTLEQIGALSRFGDEMRGTFTVREVVVKSGYNIIPEEPLMSSLGTEDKPFSSVYIGPGSLYVDGKRVISSTASTLLVTTDLDQHLTVSTSGLGTTRLASGKEVFLWSGQDINIQSLNNLNVLASGQMEFSVDVQGRDILFETKATLGQINFKSLNAINFDSPSVTFTHRPTVGGKAVLIDPYIHPETHPASMIEQDELHRFVSDVQIAAWNAKEDAINKGKPGGYASLDTNAKIPLSQIPDAARQQTYIVANSAEREALTGLLTGDKCYETESGDSYIYDGTQWLVFVDADWINVEISWEQIVDIPSTFPPSAHKSTHAIGGIDPISPSDIGAETPLGAQAKVDVHAGDTDNPHQVTATQTGALVSIDGVSNPGGNIDLVAGSGIQITPNNTLKQIRIDAVVDEYELEPHAHTHAKGGEDTLTPDAIGAPSLDDDGAIILGNFRIGYNSTLGTLDFYEVV